MDRPRIRCAGGSTARGAVVTGASSATAERLAALVAAAGLDAGAGLQVVDVARLAAVPIDPAVTLIVLASQEPLAPPHPGRHVRGEPLEVLRALYPSAHTLTRLPDGRAVALADLDDARLREADWLVAAALPTDGLGSPHALPWIAARLRAPDGCPWDREQDHRTLRRYLLEEAYETVDAIEGGTPAELAEELGDVFLQVVLHAQLAAEAGQFDLTDVYRVIAAKIVRRHPHVFAGLHTSGVDEVARNWERLKETDPDNGDTTSRRYERLLRAQPALPASRELQERAAAAGWDWLSVEGVWEKVAEELEELRAAPPAGQLHEIGDLLFVIVNLARWLGVDAEEALRAANRRWVARLREVERLAGASGARLSAMTPEEKDALWQRAKGVRDLERA